MYYIFVFILKSKFQKTVVYLHYSVYGYMECRRNCKQMVDIYYTVNHFRINMDLMQAEHKNCGIVSKESVFVKHEN